MKLPAINELYESKELMQKQDALTVLLNQEPSEKWLKVNKYANNSRYIPIERVEWLLRKIFKSFKIEVIEVKQMFNGVSVVVRIHYKDPVTGDWLFHDGVGAAQIQTSKGSSPAQLENINNNALTLCVPIAKSEALKNAAKMFGKLFGSDLNRKQQTSYNLDLTLIEMTPGHPNWEGCITGLRSGYSIEDIESKYQITEENKTELLKLSKDEI